MSIGHKGEWSREFLEGLVTKSSQLTPKSRLEREGVTLSQLILEGVDKLFQVKNKTIVTETQKGL